MSAEAHRQIVTNPAGFATFLASWGGKRCESMLGSAAAARKLFELVHATSLQKLPLLDRRRNHQTRDLCADVWPDLLPRETKCAGMCMAFMARKGVLPLVLHQTKSGSGAKKYWIAPAGMTASMVPAI